MRDAIPDERLLCQNSMISALLITKDQPPATAGGSDD